MNGLVVMEGDEYQATLQKKEKDDQYKVYFKGSGDISVKYIEQTLYPTFNVEEMDFWPEDDDNALEVVHERYHMRSQMIELPRAYLTWFPRLIY